MTSNIVVDVNESDFEYEVLSFSQNVPVVVDFWASWCNPCKVLGPLLERLAREANGAFRLARVDTDANPNLAIRYGVRSLPTVKAFSQAQAVLEFVGALPEARIREFIGKITPPSPTSLAVEKAESLLALHQWVAAETMFRELMVKESDSPIIWLGIIKALLGQGRGDEAMEFIRRFPESRQLNTAETLRPLAQALIALHNNSLPDEQDLDPAFANAVRLAGRGNIPAGLDGLLDILRQNKHYRNGLVRQIVLSLLELLGEDDPQTRQYRAELASTLF